MDANQTLETLYYQTAESFIRKYMIEPSFHLKDIVSSVMMTRDNIRPGGSFVQAVCNNDLFDAVNRADTECRSYLHIIAAAFRYAHVKAPSHV